jgi:hypothetical protein
MPRKKKPKKITIEQMKSHIRDNLDNTGDQVIARLYEAMTGITTAQKMNDGTIRLIT